MKFFSKNPNIIFKNKILNKYCIFLVLNIFFNSLLIPKNVTNAQEIKGNSEETILNYQNGKNESEYILGPGDKIELIIYGEPELSGEYSVLNDGTIPVPYSGNVYISGMTINEASNFLKLNLKKELINPILQLRVVQSRPIRISVIGEIERPGIYTLTSNENSQTTGFSKVNISGMPTVIDAIQKAGGITKSANLSNIELTRRLPKNNNLNYEYKKTNLNFLKLILEGQQQFNPYLFDGDVIKVSKSNSVPDKIISIAQSNLSPQSISVNIIGEVNTPGKYQLESNTPLVQAILSAGGAKNWRGNRSKVLLVRVNRNGSISKKRYILNLNQDVSSKKNPLLINGDTVIVGRTTLAVSTDAISAVTSPFSDVITIFTLFKLIGD